MSKDTFKFNMSQRLTIAESGGDESGLVIGRAQFDFAENEYLIRYRAGDGRCVESWWKESALAA